MTALLAALSLLAASPAYATGGGGGSSCNVTLSPPSAVPTIFYDPFDGVSVGVTFTVEAVNQSAEPCNLSLAVASAGSSSTRYFRMVGGEKLRYVVENTDGDDYENDINEPRGWHPLAGGIGKTKIITVKVKVPSGLIAPAGDTYSNMLSLRLYRAGGGALDMVRTATANAVVDERAQVNIAGGSSSWGSWGVDSLDFNTLTTGETRSAKVQVRATTHVKIKVVSQNLGKLKHKTLEQFVPYALKLNNIAMVLDPGPGETDVSPPVSLDGTSYPMVVTIGDVSGRPSGPYKDLLTITVTPE